MKKLPLLFFVLFSLTLLGCSPLYLSRQSLMDQFAESRPEKKVTLLIMPPFVFFPGIVNGNDLRSVTCVDKKGKEQVVRVTNRTGIKIIKNDGKKTTFYFNTLILKDSVISGSKTHFFNAPIKKIKLGDISKIEIMK